MLIVSSHEVSNELFSVHKVERVATHSDLRRPCVLYDTIVMNCFANTRDSYDVSHYAKYEDR